MSLSERDAYIKAMIAKSPTFDDSGDLERVIGEEYDKHSQPLPEGKVWRWGGFLAMFRAGAAWANDMLAVENTNLKAEIALLESEQKRLVKQLDVAVFGENSASQATLGDLVMRIPDEIARTLNQFLEERRAYRSEIEALKTQLEQVDTVRSGLPCNVAWGSGGEFSDPIAADQLPVFPATYLCAFIPDCQHVWMGGTPSHQPGEHNAVCSKCGQTGENP